MGSDFFRHVYFMYMQVGYEEDISDKWTEISLFARLASQTHRLLTLEPPGAQTKAAFVSQFVSHLRIKLTSQVWRTEMFLTPHHPSRLCQCTCELCLIYLWKLYRGITLSAKGMTRTLQHTNTDILCGPA